MLKVISCSSHAGRVVTGGREEAGGVSCIQPLLGLQGKNIGQANTPGNALLGGFSFEGSDTAPAEIGG